MSSNGHTPLLILLKIILGCNLNLLSNFFICSCLIYNGNLTEQKLQLQEQEELGIMAYCAQCGKAVKEGARFCAACGTQVNESSDQVLPSDVVAAAPPFNAADFSQNVSVGTSFQVPAPTFQQPEKKKFPVWATVLIVTGILLLLGACCVVGVLALSDSIREEINMVVGRQQNAVIAEFTEVDGVVHFEQLIYKVMEAQGTWIAIIGGDLSDDVSLPATIEVAVPAGASVFWFGEIGPSGDPDLDPKFAYPYQWRTEGDFDIYTAILTHYHRIQIEFVLDSSPVSSSSDGATISIEYVPLHDAPELRLAAAVPVEAVVSDLNLEFLGAGPDGELAFAYLILDAPSGMRQSTQIAYTID